MVRAAGETGAVAWRCLVGGKRDPLRPVYGDIGPSGVEAPEAGGGEVRKDPPSFTREKREQFLRSVASGLSRGKALERVGLSWNTYTRARNASPAFAAAVDSADRESWDIAVEQLRAAVVDGEPWAVQLVLKKHKALAEEWSGDAQRIDVRHSGTVEQRVSVEGLAGLAEDLRVRRAELEDIGMSGGDGLPLLELESTEDP